MADAHLLWSSRIESGGAQGGSRCVVSGLMILRFMSNAG